MSWKSPDGYVTIGEAAARLCVSPVTVRRWMRAGRLAWLRVSERRAWVRIESVESLIKGQSHGEGEETREGPGAEEATAAPEGRQH